MGSHKRRDRTSTPRPTKIPLLLLAGRDRKAPAAPAAGQDDQQILTGFKAIDTRIDGQALIEVLVERLHACGAFYPIALVGPREAYAQLDLDVQWIDSDSSFGGNLRTGIETLVEQINPKQLGFTTCDILPTPDDLERLLDDFWTYQPTDFWMPQHPVTDPDELSSSSYKPRYGFVPEGSAEPIPTLPIHLVIADPQSARRHLVYEIFDMAYATRSRSVSRRRGPIIKNALGLLLRTDLKRLKQGQWPTLSARMLWHGVHIARKLRMGHISVNEMADRLRKIWMTDSHRRAFPNRRGRVALVKARSLARDVDTPEEARELVARGHR